MGKHGSGSWVPGMSMEQISALPPGNPGFTARIILGVIRVYRAIPPSIRRTWSFGSSTSHIAQAAFNSGNFNGVAALALFARFATPSYRPGPSGLPDWFSPNNRTPVNWDN